MLNTKGPAAVAAAERQLQQQFAQPAQTHVRTASEAGSEVDNNSEHSSGYSSRSTHPLQTMPNIPNGMHCSSSPQMQQPMSMPMLTNTYVPQGLGVENGYPHQQKQDNISHEPEHNHETDRPTGSGETVKAFACTNCKKGFARRSDLARHGKWYLFELCNVVG